MRIAINGFGRIGRNIVRAIYESELQTELEVVAINDLMPLQSSTQLLAYDSTHGKFSSAIQSSSSAVQIGADTVSMFQQRNPQELPWNELGIDLVFECTGFFRDREGANKHLQAGAKKVLVSAPGKGILGDGETGLDKTIVFGVNDDQISKDDLLISNGSCTTNCLAHVAKAVDDRFGIEYGLANSVHAYTNTQNLLDAYHKDPRRGRAAAQSIIPTSTGSARAIGEVLPNLEGKLDAVATRVPTLNVSLLDFTFVPSKPLSINELEETLLDYATTRTGVFELSNAPLVSIDFNHNPASCIVDWPQTRHSGKMVKIQAWYDNEWAFSNRMLDTGRAMF